MLPTLSIEQNNIIKLLHNNNIIVDAVAGSGKTTTSLQIAMNNTNLSVLLLTYNSRLKSETREKIKKLNVANMEAHSYHSYNTTYYNKDNYTDMGILKTCKNNVIPNNKNKYDIILLDEAQDMTPTYYKFACKILCDIGNKNIRICLLGDRNQNIFSFNKADSRFLTNADKLFNYNNATWQQTTLSTSYRMTNQNGHFVNHMLKENRLKTMKDGAKVLYMRMNIYNNLFEIHELIQKYYKLGYKNDDIFILAPSVKSSGSPIRKLANYLSLVKNINLYVSNNDNEIVDEEILKNKIVMTTFHQVKGLERKIVIVTSFDESYYTYYSKGSDPTICTNELYVACTRATERLIVIQNPTNKPLSFVSMDYVYNNCSIYIDYVQVSENMNISGIQINYNDLVDNVIAPFYDKVKFIKRIQSNDSSNVDYNEYQFNNYRIGKLLTKYNTVLSKNFDINNIDIILHHLYEKSNDYIKYTVNYNNNHHSFKINNKHLTIDECIEIIGIIVDKFINSDDDDNNNSDVITHYNVTDLCKFLPTTTVSKIIGLLEIKNIKSADQLIKIYNRQRQINGNSKLYEEVSTIIGTAIPCIYEYITTGKISIISDIKRLIIVDVIAQICNDSKYRFLITTDIRTKITKINCTSKKWDNIKYIINKLLLILEPKNSSDDLINKKILELIKANITLLEYFNKKIDSKDYSNIPYFMKLANLYQCIKSGYYHPLKQITCYDWIKPTDMDIILNRMKENISPNSLYERSLRINNKLLKSFGVNYPELQNMGLHGQIDCWDLERNIIWEFKCSKSMSFEFYIQLALYAYLFYRCRDMNAEINNNVKVGDEIYYFMGNKMKSDEISATRNNCYVDNKNNIIYSKQIIYNVTQECFVNIEQLNKTSFFPKFYLFNIFTNQIDELIFETDNLIKIVDILIKHKTTNNHFVTDEQFLKNNIAKQY